MAEHEDHEAEELDFEAGDFWVQIESRQGDGAILDQNLNLATSGNVANGTVLTTLLFAYIGYHERLLGNHQCGNPDCRLVLVSHNFAHVCQSSVHQSESGVTTLSMDDR